MDASINSNRNQSAIPTITVKVLFFASSRDAVNGISQMDLVVPCTVVDDDGNSIATSNTIRSCLIEQYPKLHKYVHTDISSITMALNEEYIPQGIDIPVHNGDTIAIIPPISGG
jgi:molybdopterin converting factor small subunit